jgi:hypothetical protein
MLPHSRSPRCDWIPNQFESSFTRLAWLMIIEPYLVDFQCRGQIGSMIFTRRVTRNGGQDLRGLPLIERKQRLRELVNSRHCERIIYARQIETHEIALFEEIRARDLERIKDRVQKKAQHKQQQQKNTKIASARNITRSFWRLARLRDERGEQVKELSHCETMPSFYFPRNRLPTPRQNYY